MKMTSMNYDPAAGKRMEVSAPRRIVLLGKTGIGKSSLANILVGDDKFKIDHSGDSGTSECQADTVSVNGRSVTVVDTPGFFDTRVPDEVLKKAILSCMIECSPGPHVFLIMLKVEKFTEHEKAVVAKIGEYFSEEAFRFAAVVFTHGDQLPEGMKIEEWVEKTDALRELVRKCSGRCHVIDNKYWKTSKDEYRSNEVQVAELLKTINKIFIKNKGGFYTNEMLQKVEEQIAEEEKRIRESSVNLKPEEIRKQAKKKTLEKLLIIYAGVTGVVLLGALLGLTVAAVLAAPAVAAGVAVGGIIGVTAAAAGGFKGICEISGKEEVVATVKEKAAAVKEKAAAVKEKAAAVKEVVQVFTCRRGYQPVEEDDSTSDAGRETRRDGSQRRSQDKEHQP